jgi:hypothetical protein
VGWLYEAEAFLAVINEDVIADEIERRRRLSIGKSQNQSNTINLLSKTG